jgi:hypothetical protein
VRSAETRRALDAAFADCRASLLQPDGLSGERSRTSIGALVSVARQYDLPPERFLALFKRMAANLPAIVRLRANERVDAMHLIVQNAIDIYYASGPATDGDGATAESPHASDSAASG